MRPFTTRHVSHAACSPNASCATHGGDAAAASAAASPRKRAPAHALPPPQASDLDAQQGLYRLQCVIEHIGRTMHGGHYVAYVRMQDKWLKCDDLKVSEARTPSSSF